MRRTWLRVVQAVVTAVSGLLVVPVAVNVGTGGQPPGWLEPYVGWLWPVALVGVAVVVALEILDQRRDPAGISPRRQQDPRNVERALAQVERYVAERQRGSLTGRLRVALALDERPASVRQPAHLVQRVSGTEFELSTASDIADLFTTMDESMLLLGAPGAGKTTQLLDLAAALVARARADVASGSPPAVPVLVDLAEWSRSGVRRFAGLGSRERGPVEFVRWLIDTLQRRYHIPEAVGRAWLDDDRLVVLLDGLDEVREADRAQCVRAIDALQERHGVTRLAVCCRVADYHRLTEQLRLQGAVEIRLLTREQVDGFLRAASPRLSGVATVLAEDVELWQLLTTPLMLTIMVIAEEGRAVTALAEGADAAERRRLLFDAYVVEVLARPRRYDRGDPDRVLRAIRLLASASAALEPGVRVLPLDFRAVDGMGDSVRDVLRLWLRPATVFLVTVVPPVVLGVLVSAPAGRIVVVLGVLMLFVFASRGEPSAIVPGRPWLFVCYALVVTLVLASAVVGAVRLVDLVGQPRVVPTVAVAVGLVGVLVALSWMAERQFQKDLVAWIVIPGIIACAAVLSFGVTRAALEGWTVGLVYGVCISAMIMVEDSGTGTTSNAPAALLVHRRMFWIYAIAALALPWFVAGPDGRSIVQVVVGYVLGVVGSLGLAVAVSGLFAVPYLHVALVMAGEGDPWRRSFLRFAADRSLLTFVDGEYRFVHLLVRDHLAACNPVPLAAAVSRRRAELAER